MEWCFLKAYWKAVYSFQDFSSYKNNDMRLYLPPSFLHAIKWEFSEVIFLFLVCILTETFKTLSNTFESYPSPQSIVCTLNSEVVKSSLAFYQYMSKVWLLFERLIFNQIQKLPYTFQIHG